MRKNSVWIRCKALFVAAPSFSVCVLMCAAWACPRLSAQSSSPATPPTLTARALDSSANAFGFSGLRHFNAETLPWRFRAGDSAEWSSPLYDDSAWNLLAPSSATDYENWSPELFRESIGWFRAPIRVDGSLHGRSVAFALSLGGAAEIYLDGNLIGEFGAPSSQVEDERLPLYARFLLRSITIRLDSGRSHLIAVRYSFAHYPAYRRYFALWMRGQAPALRTAFISVDSAEEYRRAAFAIVIQFGSSLGMPLLAAILHFVLFLFYRRDTANLYVACFSLVSAVLALSFALAAHVMGQTFEIAVFAQLFVYAATTGIVLALWLVASALFFPETLRFRRVFVVAVLCCFVGIVAGGFVPEPFGDIVELGLLFIGLTPLFHALILITRAMRSKLDGSYLLGGAMAVCIAAWVLEITLVLNNVFYAARPLWAGVFIRFGIYIAIPLSLSVLLARRAALQAAALAEQNERLEERVAKRTEDLRGANAELHDKNLRLEEANREKNEILGIVSHDLKNPISAVQGFAEFIAHSASALEEARAAAGHIAQTSDRMLQLVKNILDFNRVESGGMHFDFVTFDTAAAVEHALYDYRPTAAEKRIELVYENLAHENFVSEASKGKYIYADEQAVAQIIDNLLSNAVKYSSYGSTVRLRLQERVAAAADRTSDQARENGGEASALAKPSPKPLPKPLPKHYIRLEVEDEGPGVSDEDREQLFQKFTRLSARPTGGEHSTGLGLSIAKSLADAMNARLWCEPFAPGKGAVFVLEFPCAPLKLGVSHTVAEE